jgi:hypothetical protein
MSIIQDLLSLFHVCRHVVKLRVDGRGVSVNKSPYHRFEFHQPALVLTVLRNDRLSTLEFP